MAAALLLWTLASALARSECNGDSCPATNLAGPPADSDAAQTLALGAGAETKRAGGAGGAAGAARETRRGAAGVDSGAQRSQAAVGPHVVVVHDNPSVKLNEVLGVLGKLGVSDQGQATQLVQMIKQRGSAVVVEGNHDACQQVAGLFNAISMKAEVRPKRKSDTPSEYSGSDVLTLDAAELEQLRRSDTPVLVTFFAPWCGHCRQLAPDFKKAASKLKESGIATVAINGDQEGALARQLGIKGYPTIKFMYKGDIVDYKGPRAATEIVGFAQGQARILFLKSQATKLVGGVASRVKEVVSKVASSRILQRNFAATAA